MATGEKPNLGSPHDSAEGLDLAAAGRLLAFLEASDAPDGDAAGGDLGDGGEGREATIRIPGYRVDCEIGRGGGGVVYRAYREGGSDRALALKVLNVALGDPARSKPAQRAWRELGVLSDLHLPCLPRVVDYGVHEGRLYIATDWIDGLPLDQHCQAKGLDRRARVVLLAEVADAVQMLHEHGVIHRDLKPSNILVDSHGRPMIVDFGLAALAAEGADPVQTLSMEGAPLGTPAFMSPEQARGERVVPSGSGGTGILMPVGGEGAREQGSRGAREKAGGVSTRSDVYSLGATAYVILTGHTPHDMNVSLHEAVRRVAMEPARDARGLEPGLPKALGAVLGKACAFGAGERYGSAGEMGEDLRRWTANRAVLATRPSPWRKSMEWLSRHPVAATIAMCMTIAAAIMGGTLLSVRWANQEPMFIKFHDDESPFARLIARSGNTLHQWGTGEQGCMMFAQLVDRPEAFGGGKLALLGFRLTNSPELCAFDASLPRVRVWGSGFKPDRFENPGTKPQRGSKSFYVYQAMVADVFPQSPGMEVIAIHLDASASTAVVRIYDLQGEVLFEAWHWGHLYDSHWLPTAGVLVLSGVNSEARWSDRGVNVAQPWPQVVFGIKPILGQKQRWLSTPTEPGDSPCPWYRCALPAEAFDEPPYRLTLLAPLTGYADPGTHVSVGAGPVQMVVDAAGVTQRTVIMEAQNQRPAMANGSREPIERLYLGELPPIPSGVGQPIVP